MKYYAVKPEVAGGFGPRTVIDRSAGRLTVKELHYVFDGWLGDELLVSVPAFIVSERLGRAIEQAALSGTRLGPVEVTTSEQFKEIYPNRSLPRFLWLQVVGEAGRQDFGLLDGVRLVVSERALQLLRVFELKHAMVSPVEKPDAA